MLKKTLPEMMEKEMLALSNKIEEASEKLKVMKKNYQKMKNEKVAKYLLKKEKMAIKYSQKLIRLDWKEWDATIARMYKASAI